MSSALTAFLSSQLDGSSQGQTGPRTKSLPATPNNSDTPRRRFIHPEEVLNGSSISNTQETMSSPSGRGQSTFDDIPVWPSLNRSGPSAGTRLAGQPHNLAAPSIENRSEDEIRYEPRTPKEVQRRIALSNPNLDADTLKRELEPLRTKKGKFCIKSEELRVHVVRLWGELRGSLWKNIIMDLDLRTALRSANSHYSERRIALAKYRLSAKDRRRRYPFAYTAEGKPYQEWRASCRRYGEVEIDGTVERIRNRSGSLTRSLPLPTGLQTPPSSSPVVVVDNTSMSPHSGEVKPEYEPDLETSRTGASRYSDDPDDLFVQNRSTFTESVNLRKRNEHLMRELESGLKKQRKLAHLIHEQNDADRMTGEKLQRLRAENIDLTILLGRSSESCSLHQSSSPSGQTHDRMAENDHEERPALARGGDSADSNSSANNAPMVAELIPEAAPAVEPNVIVPISNTSATNALGTAEYSDSCSSDANSSSSSESSDDESDCSASEASEDESDDGSASESADGKTVTSESDDGGDEDDEDDEDDSDLVAQHLTTKTAQVDPDHAASGFSAVSKEQSVPKEAKRKRDRELEPASDAAHSFAKCHNRDSSCADGRSESIPGHNGKRRKNTHPTSSKAKGAGHEAGSTLTTSPALQTKTPRPMKKQRAAQNQSEKQKKREQMLEDPIQSANPQDSALDSAQYPEYQVMQLNEHGRPKHIRFHSTPPSSGSVRANFDRYGAPYASITSSASRVWSLPSQPKRHPGTRPILSRQQKRKNRKKRNRTQSSQHQGAPARVERRGPPPKKERAGRDTRDKAMTGPASTERSFDAPDFRESLKEAALNLLLSALRPQPGSARA